MSSEVSGVPLNVFEDPIIEALAAYSEMTNGRVVFEDPQVAAKLELTPDKPNSARSITQVKHLGEVAGTLFVIAFAPGDGTGDESAFKLDQVNKAGFPRDSKILPRSKAGINSEAHLTIATKRVDSPNTDPFMFSGSLDLIGLDEDHPTWLAKIGTLGQTKWTFETLWRPDEPRRPTTTLTVGYHQSRTDMFRYNRNIAEGEKFGDPHAVYNPIEDIVQVCGFLAIKDEDAQTHVNTLYSLQAQEPELSRVISPFKAGTFYR